MSKIVQPKFWPHIMSVMEIKHCRGDEVLWEDYNLPNIFNEEGEIFCLSALFDTDAGYSIPSFYFIGLDNRTAIDFSDTMASITGEPSSDYSYYRQAVSSSQGMAVTAYGSHYKAVSGIITFSAIGGSWGPVSNVFFTNASDNSGILIASVPLSSARTVNSGETLTVRIGLSFKDC